MITKPVAPPRELPMPWWTAPAGITVGFLLPIFFLIGSIGTSNQPGLTIRWLRFLSLDYVVMGVTLLLVIALAGWIGSRLPGRPASAHGRELRPSDWDQAALVVGCIALMAYLYWFKDFLLNPLLLLHTVTGAYRPDRGNITLSPGVTSLSNFAPAFFSVYAYRVAFGSVRLSAWMHRLFVLLLAMTLFRVYAWSERLALIEIMMPIGLALGGVACNARQRWIRTLALLGPFAALPALVFYFGLAEYFRSWASPTYNGKLGFWEFALGRMASYYYTSLNNGAGLLATGHWPTYQFEYTLAWLHRAPFGIGHAFSAWTNLSVPQPELFLQKFADPEFNNPSGLYAVVIDMGLPLGIAYFALTAIAGGLLLRAYRRGSLTGVVFYPLLFLSYLEVFRYPYLGESRSFTWMLGSTMVLLLVRLSAQLRKLPGSFDAARADRWNGAGTAATHGGD